MRRREPPSQAGRGKSLIATRANLYQRKLQNVGKTQIPRSFSSPAPHQSSSKPPEVTRSLSSPDRQPTDFDRFSNQSKSHDSRNEVDSDLDNLEIFDALLDIDAEDQSYSGSYESSRNQITPEPQRVKATIQPGSGIQKVSVWPIKNRSISSPMQSAKQIIPEIQRKYSDKGLDFRPLIVNLPSRHAEPVVEMTKSVTDELRTSPSLVTEDFDMDRELEIAEKQMESDVAFSVEENFVDSDMV